MEDETKLYKYTRKIRPNKHLCWIFSGLGSWIDTEKQCILLGRNRNRREDDNPTPAKATSKKGCANQV